MNIFSEISRYGHEQVVFCHDEDANLKAIIAIHDTTLGPSLGGTRMWNYSSEGEAITDVLRLSQAMTYKAAVAGLNLGGGKSVIIGDPRRSKTEALLRAHGRFIESLGGRYITAEDVGIGAEDLEYVHMETRYVTGTPTAQGGSGDPSPVTAYGVFHGMKACAKEKFGNDSLEDLRVAIQGAGHVGYYLAKYLREEGAKLIITDIDEAREKLVIEEFGAIPVNPDEIYGVEAEIFAPCALGAILNDRTIPQLKVKIVAGGANNQLAEERHGVQLEKNDILYAPDYVINAGGLINVYGEIEGYVKEKAVSRAEGIYNTLTEIFSIAKKEGIPNFEAANRLAEKRLGKVSSLKRTYIPFDRVYRDRRGK
jgi:leucine dehydrogenase